MVNENLKGPQALTVPQLLALAVRNSYDVMVCKLNKASSFSTHSSV